MGVNMANGQLFIFLPHDPIQIIIEMAGWKEWIVPELHRGRDMSSNLGEKFQVGGQMGKPYVMGTPLCCGL